MQMPQQLGVVESLIESGTPESGAVIRNQIQDMINPHTSRDSVFVGQHSEDPFRGKTLKGVFKAEEPIGTFYTTDLEKAKAFRENPQNVGALLGYDQPKDTIQNPASVAAYDQLGNLQHLEGVEADNASQVRMKYHDGGYPSTQVVSPDEGLMLRAQENERLGTI